MPPLGVFLVSGCGADLLINICLTILGYVLQAPLTLNRRLTNYSVFPGHIHAFYVEYVYLERREQQREGRLVAQRAPGIYSERVQTGDQKYGVVDAPVV